MTVETYDNITIVTYNDIWLAKLSYSEMTEYFRWALFLVQQAD